MRVFQLWRVRDGKVVVMRAFLTEQEALAAAAAS
jgi:ketosteroid isomerase-like protein